MLSIKALIVMSVMRSIKFVTITQTIEHLKNDRSSSVSCHNFAQWELFSIDFSQEGDISSGSGLGMGSQLHDCCCLLYA